MSKSLHKSFTRGEKVLINTDARTVPRIILSQMNMMIVPNVKVKKEKILQGVAYAPDPIEEKFIQMIL
jgi:hypothetical protein